MQHGPALGVGRRGGVGRKAGLARARLATEQHDLRHAGLGSCSESAQQRKLRRSPGERCCGCADDGR